MPEYTYKRHDGTLFTIRQSIKEQPLKVCPTTGQPVKRVIHARPVHFKGPGFYETDYKNK